MKTEFLDSPGVTGDFYQPFPESLVTAVTSEDGVTASVAPGADYDPAAETGDALTVTIGTVDAADKNTATFKIDSFMTPFSAIPSAYF